MSDASTMSILLNTNVREHVGISRRKRGTRAARAPAFVARVVFVPNRGPGRKIVTHPLKSGAELPRPRRASHTHRTAPGR
mgnify:CR=1 FL=1